MANTKKYVALLLLLLAFFRIEAQHYKQQMMKYSRVRAAFEHCETDLKARLKAKQLNLYGNKLLIVGYKREMRLEAWMLAPKAGEYVKVWESAICAMSGVLGPKRKMGDGQVPEGVYTVSYFNPTSNFHLSLKVSYPNASDRKRGVKGNLGNDIFIHGSCVTIGCIPITDERIEELFVLAVASHDAGAVDVLIFPCELTAKNLTALKSEHEGDADKIRLWNELQPIFNFWTTTHKKPTVSVDATGAYKLR